MKKISYYASTIFASIAAVSLVSTASWVFTNQPNVPTELLKK